MELTTEKLKEIGEMEEINKNVINIESDESDGEIHKKKKNVGSCIKKKKYITVNIDDEHDFINSRSKSSEKPTKIKKSTKSTLNDEDDDNISDDSEQKFGKLNQKYRAK